jgi:hypothetical protein
MIPKYPTTTLTSDGCIVPWLAAEGLLAYTPENPPCRDYYFQYGWVMPAVIRSGDKRHYYFGAGHKSEADDVFRFWNDARARRTDHVVTRMGINADGSITAPIAVYRHPVGYNRKPGYIFIQHGSYQTIEQKSQPLIEKGLVVLYRGIEKTADFRYLHFDPSRLAPERFRAWSLYCKTQWWILSDSSISFKAVHDSVVRCETSHLHERTYISEKLAAECGLDLKEGGIGRTIWDYASQSFSLGKWVAERKFGPNYVAFQTPVDNIRITTFFAGEFEACIVDPSKLELLEACGCKACAVSLP